MYGKSFPLLKTGNFLMRSIYPSEDAKAYYTYMRNPLVTPFLAKEDIPETLENAEHHLQYWARLYERKLSIYWAIVDTVSDTFIGTCGFNNWSKPHARGDLSYDLAPLYWGKGIMYQVLKAVIDFAFEEMQMERIQAMVAIHNPRSVRLLEKLSFKQEGKLHHYAKLEGTFCDFYLYAHIRSLL